MEDLTPEEQLLQKHRNERKELQAKIQSIKKGDGKADKKKKKESLELISRLETELKERQQTELDELKNQIDELTINQDDQNSTELHPTLTVNETIISNSDRPVRLTKAQKRRDKKVQQEKEAQERIAAQEIENENGPRNLENQAFSKILKDKHLSLHLIPSNGDCLFQAVSHQLGLTGRPEMSVKDLRVKAAEYMRKHREDLIPFLINESDNVISDEGYHKYCDSIANTNVWGGQLELVALTESLHCPIQVLQASGSHTLLGESFSGAPLVLTYHRHMYGLGEHYNSTIKK